MKVLVCGGRNFHDGEIMLSTLLDIHATTPITHVIHGGASGADRFAGSWARNYGVQEVRCDANWGYYGPAAGPIRNNAMLALLPDIVVAFPGGKGTKNMVRLAKAAGFNVKEILSEKV